FYSVVSCGNGVYRRPVAMAWEDAVVLHAHVYNHGIHLIALNEVALSVRSTLYSRCSPPERRGQQTSSTLSDGATHAGIQKKRHPSDAA
ncbi:MAG: hypothetical protein VX589_15325, partial [Myxococcota bacterium]|nr:hypothetical protein [Myxococcota bacterium]